MLQRMGSVYLATQQSSGNGASAIFCSAAAGTNDNILFRQHHIRHLSLSEAVHHSTGSVINDSHIRQIQSSMQVEIYYMARVGFHFQRRSNNSVQAMQPKHRPARLQNRYAFVFHLWMKR